MNQNNKIFHPAPYIEKQVAPVLKANDLSKEVVWTYLVARKYQDNQAELIKKICGVDESLPQEAKYGLRLIYILHGKGMKSVNAGAVELICQLVI